MSTVTTASLSEDLALKHTSIGGKTEFTPYSQCVSNKAQRLFDSRSCTSKEEELAVQRCADNWKRNAANLEYQLQIRFKGNKRLLPPPKEIAIVKVIERVREGALAQQIRPSIYEKNQYHSLEWMHRIAMIETAFASHQIFSISLVPTDPSTPQTWYDQKTYTDISSVNSDLNVEGRRYLAGNGEELTNFRIGKLQKLSNCRATPTTPSRVFPGFFTPFPNYSSDIATPKYDPENLPNSVITANASSEKELQSALALCTSPNLKSTISTIVTLFTDDAHAIGLGLVTLQAPSPIVFYFTKRECTS